MAKRKPDRIDRAAAKIASEQRDLNLGIAESCKRTTTANLPHQLAGITAALRCQNTWLSNRIAALVRRDLPHQLAGITAALRCQNTWLSNRIAALVRREVKRERKAMREAIETARGNGSYYMTVQLKNWLDAREAGR